MENITEYIDNRKHTVEIFVDLNKGFDTFDHKILLQRNGKIWCERGRKQLVKKLS